MKNLYRKFCPCCCRDGMQNILASYKRKIKLVKKLLQSSNLVYCPVPLIIPSLVTHKHPPQTIENLKLPSICQAQYQRDFRPFVFALIFYTYNIYIYEYFILYTYISIFLVPSVSSQMFNHPQHLSFRSPPSSINFFLLQLSEEKYN